MRKLLLAFMLLSIFGCKSKMESVRDLDMTKFCKDYYILINPGNDVFYVFVSRENIRERFIVYKDMDKEGTGYGFCYGSNTDLQDILKNGVFGTVEEAISKGKENYKNNGASLWLTQLVTFDDKKWIVYGETLQELCPK